MMDGSVVMANAPTMQDCIAMMEDIIAVFQGGDDIVTVDEIREKGEMIRCETGKREENLEDLTSSKSSFRLSLCVWVWECERARRVETIATLPG